MSSSSSLGGADQPDSLRLLHSVNRLREESDQASQALQREESNIRALQEALSTDESEQQKLFAQINRMRYEGQETKSRLRAAISELSVILASRHELAFQVDALEYQRKEAENEWLTFQEACLEACKTFQSEASDEMKVVKAASQTLEHLGSELRTTITQHTKSSEERDGMSHRVCALTRERDELRRDSQLERQRTSDLSAQLEKMNGEIAREEEAFAELQGCHAALKQQIDQANRSRINAATR